MDFGFHESLKRAVMMHSDGLEHVRESLQTDISGLGKTMNGLDSRNDKQQFLMKNNAAFKVPPKFEERKVRRDETENGPIYTHKGILDELHHRRGILKDRYYFLCQQKRWPSRRR